MARLSAKTALNPYYQARLEASKTDPRFSSRSGAAEAMGMSEDSLADTELGCLKCMPPDKAEIMAITYKAPQLIGHYCERECPLGKYQYLTGEVISLEQSIVKLEVELDEAIAAKKMLERIGYDGIVNDGEATEFRKAVGLLTKLEKTIGSLRVYADRWRLA